MAKKKIKQKTTLGRDVKATSSSAPRPKSQDSGKKQSQKSESFFNRHLLSIVLLAITAIAMGPVVFNDFISLDDTQFITENKIVQNGDVESAIKKQMYSPHYKPLVYLGWIAEVSIFGNNPYVLHTNNLILHVISTLLVFFCMLRIAQFWPETRAHDNSIAFFTALLFGIHPLHVESVAWAIERKDVLFSAFYFAGLLSYLKYIQEGQRKFLYLTAALYMLSLLSKSMGITLIGMTFLIDWASGRRDWKKMLVEKWPLYIPLLISVYLYGFIYHPRKVESAIAGLGEGAVEPPSNIAHLPGIYQQILIAIYRYLFFFFHTLVPAKLGLVYPREPMLAWPGQLIHLAILVIGGIAALPWILRKYRDLLLTGLVFFTMSLAPILIEEGPGTNFGSDRYTYVPSVGLFLLISTLFCHYFRKTIGKFTVGTLSLSVFCGLLAVATFFQARKWGSSFDLYDQAVKNYKDNWVALHYRGGANEDINADAAIADYSKSIELDPGRFRPWFARGTLYLKLLKYNEAIADMTKTLELNPRYEKAWVNRGNAYRDLGKNDLAIADYNAALKLKPRFDKALNNRGAAYLKKGMFDAALEDFNKVLKLDPNYVNGYINRAALYINPEVQQYQLAIQDYDKALALDAHNVQARYFRGVALRSMGKHPEALSDIEQAIAMSPNTGLYHFTRAPILRSLGKVKQAVEAAQKAQSLGYKVPAEYLQ